MEGKLFWILSAVSVSFAANIPFFDRSRESDSVRQSIDPAYRFLADPIANHYDCSSLSCSESAKIGLESKIQKARRLLRLLEDTQNSSPLLKLEGFPKAQPLKRSSLKNDASKDLSFEDYPKDSVTPAKQTTEESPDDESPEKWFIPIEPRPYKSPDNSPETWFRPIVSRPYKSPRDEQLDVPTPIPTELSVDVIQEPEQDSDRAIEATPQKMGKYSNLEKGVFEPITVLALKIFNSLPKPKSKDNELHNKEWKGVGNRSEKEEEVRDIEEVGGGDSVPESLVNVVVQKSKKADNGKMNNKGLETDFNLKEPSSESSGSMDVDFGDKLSAPTGATASYNTRDGGEKIRFRPRRNYLTQLLRHTQVKKLMISSTTCRNLASCKSWATSSPYFLAEKKRMIMEAANQGFVYLCTTLK